MILELRSDLPVYVFYEKPAHKFFEKHKDLQERYEASIKELHRGEHPERVDIKLLEGKQGEYFRMRLGKWRVIFTVDRNIIIVNTLEAGSRGDIYKKIGGLKIL